MDTKINIKSLDGIRALAILMIMTYHAGLFHFTWVSVQLFFVLSGFLITGILWKDKFKDESTSFKLKRFWVRRSLRIFPLYVAYLGIISLVYLFFKFPSYYTDYIYYLITYTVNFSRLIPSWQGNPLFTHLWTLSIEEQFYLFFPVIIFLTPAKFIKYLLVSLLFLSPLCRYLLGEYYKNQNLSPEIVSDVVYWNTLSHLDAFAIGAIIPVFNLQNRVSRPINLLRFSILIGLTVGVINFFSSATDLPFWDDFGYNHLLISNYQHIWHYTFINLTCAALILVLISPNSKNSIPIFRRFLENRWMVRIGKVSYCMYMLHWIVLTYLIYKWINPEEYLVKLLLFVPYVLILYAISEISYSLFEVKFINLKDKFYLSQNNKNKARNKTAVPLEN